MGEEARVEITGDTTKLDRAVERSAQKSKQVAELTAKDLEQINAELERKAEDDMRRIGARAATTTEAVSRPMLKAKDDLKLFNGVGLRVGATVATALIGATTAAKALNNELRESLKLKADLGKSQTDRTVDAATALANSNIVDPAKIMAAANSASGPVKQDQLNTFVTKLAESKLPMNGEFGAGLVRAYAKNAPLLGDGSSLIAAASMFPDRNTQSLVDAALSYQERTGKPLSLDDLRDLEKETASAQEKYSAAQEAERQAGRGGSLSAVNSARERALAAKEALTKAQQAQSDFRASAEPVAGMTEQKLLSLGPDALKAFVLRGRQRSAEIQENEAGSDNEAIREQERELNARLRQIRNANDAAQNGSSIRRTVLPFLRTGINSIANTAGFDSPDDVSAQAGANAVLREIREGNRLLMDQTERLSGRPNLRPDAQEEKF